MAQRNGSEAGYSKYGSHTSSSSNTWEPLKNAESPTQTQWMRISISKYPQVFCMHTIVWAFPQITKAKELHGPMPAQNFSKAFLSSPHFLLQRIRVFSALSREQWGGSLLSYFTPNSFLSQRRRVANPKDWMLSAGGVITFLKQTLPSLLSLLPHPSLFCLCSGLQVHLGLPVSILWLADHVACFADSEPSWNFGNIVTSTIYQQSWIWA